MAGRFEPIAQFHFAPSDLVLLNQYPPETLKADKFRREQTIRIYRLKSP